MISCLLLRWWGWQRWLWRSRHLGSNWLLRHWRIIHNWTPILGAGLQLRRCGSSLGPFQYRLARTRRQPNSSLPRAGTGHPGLGTKHCLELFAQGLVPLRWGCAREPKRTCQGPKTHPHVSALQQSSGEAQSGRRFLGTKGGTLWLWSFLPKTGALGP